MSVLKQKVAELWTMVHYMTEVPTVKISSPLKARTSVEMQKAYTRQAQRYLEQRQVLHLHIPQQPKHTAVIFV